LVYFSAAGLLLYILPFIFARRRPDLLFWGLWLDGTIGVVAFLDFTRHTNHLGWIRYTLLAGPAVYALIPALVAQLPRVPWISFVRHAVPAALAIACAVALPNAYKSPVTDPRTIADQLRPMLDHDDLLIFVGTGDSQWWANGQCLLFSRYLKPIPCPVVILHSPADDPSVLNRITQSRRIYAFTLGEDATQFIPGTTTTSITKIPGQGRVWILTPARPSI
jgi:hypothetical protein